MVVIVVLLCTVKARLENNARRAETIEGTKDYLREENTGCGEEQKFEVQKEHIKVRAEVQTCKGKKKHKGIERVVFLVCK